MTEPTGTRRHRHHIMCGMDRICPACGKIWFAALPYGEEPLCIKEVWEKGANWYPADKARHSPAFICFDCEQCEMCLELGLDCPKRGKPLSEYGCVDDYEED